MLRVALTGGIATGKSHVLALFALRKVPTIDADRIAREVVKPGQTAWQAVRKRFGPDVIGTDGQIDRKNLAALVFANPVARKELEEIVHPHVQVAIETWFRKITNIAESPFAVADIPLLFENDRSKDFDCIVVTACDQELQLRRLMARDGLSKEAAQQRIDAQLPTADKVARATFVIQTDSNLHNTDKQVDTIYQALWS